MTTQTKTDKDFVRLGPGRVATILNELNLSGPNPGSPNAIAGRLKVPVRLVRQIRDLGPEALEIARQAASQHAYDTGRGDQNDFTRLGPKMVGQILEAIAAIDALDGRAASTLRAVADEFRVPTRLVCQILAQRVDASQKARVAALEFHDTPEIGDVEAWDERQKAPLPQPEVPMDRQREIVARYRRGVSIDDIAFDMGFHPRAVVNCLTDVGYAVALVSEAQDPTGPASDAARHAADRARAQGWKP